MNGDSDSTDLRSILWDVTNEFIDLRKARHNTGQVKYGEFTFLGNDVIRMMLEELADLCNYAEYQAAKLLMLQKVLEQDGRLDKLAEGGEIKIGVEAFKGTKEGWK